MNTSNFEKIYGGEGRVKDYNSAEILFMKALAKGDEEEALKYFKENKQVKGQSAIYTPHKNYFGLEGIKECIKEWYSYFHAVSGEFVPVTQTICGLQRAVEFVFHFVLEDGSEKSIPMAMVADMYHNCNMIDEIRTYMNPMHVEDYPKYRHPIFKEMKTRELREEMLTGLMPAYFDLVREKGMAHIQDIMTQKENVMWSGYSLNPIKVKTPEELREYLKARDERELADPASPEFYGLDTFVRIRIERIIDDGTLCCVEWEQLVTKRGREERGRLSMPGFSVYERANDGLLKSYRIIDYANLEKYIDWSKSEYTKEEAEAINYLGY